MYSADLLGDIAGRLNGLLKIPEKGFESKRKRGWF